MTILDEIIANRKVLVESEKENLPFDKLEKQALELQESGYAPAPFIDHENFQVPFLIAEIKRKSPSKGIIRKDMDVDDIARTYDSSIKVNAISVLTEPHYFNGAYKYIEQVKKLSKKPVLMKDFIVDIYQIYKGFIRGASAILLIASMQDDTEEENFRHTAERLGMNILYETHSPEEYQAAIDKGYGIIGINNRNLKTFVTDIDNTVKIIEKKGKPDGVKIITESGINSRQDVKQLTEAGVDGFLVGERFMRSRDIKKAIKEVFG